MDIKCIKEIEEAD